MIAPEKRWHPKSKKPNMPLERLIIACVCACLALFVNVPAFGQPIYAENQIPSDGVEIGYTVTIRNPTSHLYDIEMSIKGIRDTSLSVSLPAWSPGAYRIENYARNIQDFRASNTRNQPLKWEQTDKQTWRILKQPVDDVQVRYQVFSAQLTDQMADLAPPATFMYVLGRKHVACTVKYNAPSGWKVYTGLEKKADRYVASDYDIFIDAPTFIGDFKVLEFETGGASHYLVFSKRDISMTAPQVTADVQDIVEAAMRIFGKLPYQQYVFLMKVQAQATNAVEHLNSTRITVGENDFVSQASYRQFLATVAHEFFHLWNVKRIRPAVLGPFDYSREVQTRLLWMFEGVTSYYGNLLLLRSGVDNSTEYLSRMAAVIDALEHSPGRHLMSAEEASWNAWTRSDNADNNTISYYTKGELIGLILDIEIRARTKNRKSLDDVMRYLMETYANKGVGFPEDGFLRAIEAVAGSDFQELFEVVVQGRKELDYNRYLKQAGLAAQVQLQPGSIYVGVEFEAGEGNFPRVRRVAPNSPAERAKVDVGDLLVTLNEERLTFESFRSRLHSHAIGESLRLTVLRNQRLLNLNISPIEFQEVRWQLNEMPRPTPEQEALKNAWLGAK
jgi:predicted metalloprotease with PDZ domain